MPGIRSFEFRFCRSVKIPSLFFARFFAFKRGNCFGKIADVYCLNACLSVLGLLRFSFVISLLLLLWTVGFLFLHRIDACVLPEENFTSIRIFLEFSPLYGKFFSRWWRLGVADVMSKIDKKQVKHRNTMWFMGFGDFQERV